MQNAEALVFIQKNRVNPVFAEIIPKLESTMQERERKIDGLEKEISIKKKNLQKLSESWLDEIKQHVGSMKARVAKRLEKVKKLLDYETEEKQTKTTEIQQSLIPVPVD